MAKYIRLGLRAESDGPQRRGNRVEYAVYVKLTLDKIMYLVEMSDAAARMSKESKSHHQNIPFTSLTHAYNVNKQGFVVKFGSVEHNMILDMYSGTSLEYLCGEAGSSASSSAFEWASIRVRTVVNHTSAYLHFGKEGELWWSVLLHGCVVNTARHSRSVVLALPEMSCLMEQVPHQLHIPHVTL